jgi:phosphoribosylamine---glycine ligase
LTRNVLVVGSGAREHALVWKLIQSPDIGKVIVAPGNAGTAAIATNLPVSISDFDAILTIIRDHSIDLTVVGPEDPLANGLADALTTHGHAVFGPSMAGARIESSKAWAKEVMRSRNIPTGDARSFDNLPAALDFIYDAPLPIVIKADGLAAGKGVVICQDRQGAEDTARAMLEDQAFGEAGGRILIEEFLVGMEMSLLAITDGTTVVPLLPACDYKPVGTGDTGPNTGGMGAYCPPAAGSPELVEQVLQTIIHPVLDEMRHRDIVYRGVLYAGLILTDSGPKVIEFNCRFGDPEIQVVLPLLKSDLLEICNAVAAGELHSISSLKWHSGASVGVVLAAGGYPASYRSGDTITGLDRIPDGGLVFHAGTREVDGQVETAGGRVLTAVGTGATLQEARDLAYQTADAIHFNDVYRRDDIASREIIT